MMIMKTVKEWLVITAGCISFALAMTLFYEPAVLAPGGASGVAVIINAITELPLGLMIILVNIPLFILGAVKIGKNFIIKTVYATVVSSVLIDVTSEIYGKYETLTADPLICAVFGGILLAVGMGLVLKNGGSTGGSDIIAKLIRRKRYDIKLGKIFVIIDSVIIVIYALVTGMVESALYATIALFVSSYVLDIVLYGTDEAKFLVIISSKSDKIAEKFMNEINSGVTFANGKGAYTDTEKKIIFCAVKKHLYPRAREIVNEIDKESFLIVSSASEVFGTGYKKHGNQEL